MERTLILLKPDSVKRGLVGKVVSRFEEKGFKILGMKMVHPSEDHYHHHYETISALKSRAGEEIFQKNTDFMMSGPVIAVVLEGKDAIGAVRQIVGATDPAQAEAGTIRGDLGHMTLEEANSKNIGLENIIHASGNSEEAEQEVAHWFSDQELFDYKTVHEPLTQKPE
jgi:nucleoside-diphosphate kinase